MEIRNNTALITGGASGLGAATARLLHGLGANVVMVDRNAAASAEILEELADGEGEETGRAAFVAADVTSPEEMERAVEEACGKFGGLHFTINCAGIGTAGRVLGREGLMPLETFRKVVDVNLIGTFNTIRLTAEAMLKNDPNPDGERGVVINTSSIAAYEGQIGQAPYAASKAGIIGITLPIAREFAQHGIRVMTIAPGIFDTPMLAGMSDEVKESLGAQVPFPSRLGKPEEYARLVAAIITSPMMNGEPIRLDGAIRMGAR